MSENPAVVAGAVLAAIKDGCQSVRQVADHLGVPVDDLDLIDVVAQLREDRQIVFTPRVGVDQGDWSYDCHVEWAGAK